MIKKVLLTIFVVNSCSYISYTEILPTIRSVVIGAGDIEINQSYIDSKEYSFAKFKIGRSSIAILSLAYIKDGVFEWVSSSNERIFTFNGKIIKTIYFDIDISNEDGAEDIETEVLPLCLTRLD